LVTELIATSDGPIDVRLLGVASGLDQASLSDALHEALDSELVARGGPRDQLVDTRHTLVREALREALVPGQLASLHRSHADAAEKHIEWAGTSDVERVRRLANHLVAAGERQRAVPALLRAGQAARQALAFQDADEAYRQAFEQLADAPPPVAADVWRETLADAAAVARLAGASDRAVALQERAVALATDVSVDDHAMALIRLARYNAEAGRPGVAATLLREVPGHAGPEPSGRCALELARVSLATRDYPAAVDHAELARRIAHETGDSREEARAAAAMGVALSMLGRHDEALRALTASRHAGLRGEDDEPSPTRAHPSRVPDSLLRHVDRATILALAGDPEAASRAALEGAATASRSGVTGPWAAVLAAVAGREQLRLGRWDEAWATLDGVADTGPRSAAAARAVQGLLAVRRGDLATADSALAGVSIDDLAATPGTGWVGIHAMASAELAMARGSLERARLMVADGLAGSEGDPDGLQRVELAWLGLRTEADGVVQARDRRDAAAMTAGEASAMALFATGHSELARISSPGLAPWVGALRSRLDAEATRLGPGAGPVAWETAVAHGDHTPDVFGQAYTRYRLAEALLEAGSDSRAVAARVLQDCMVRARALGALPMVEDVQRLAVRARIRLDPAPETASPTSTTPRGSARALGLSEREVDVLELLAVGMTDREIGARLFITEKTAGHHVSHILTKLTVSRRGEAAAVAHRLGLVGPDARLAVDAGA
jgi:DNA-binding CsgD family transcriptional regulator/tetratricopeptide (TPR) repeat protein